MHEISYQKIYQDPLYVRLRFKIKEKDLIFTLVRVDLHRDLIIMDVFKVLLKLHMYSASTSIYVKSDLIEGFPIFLEY